MCAARIVLADDDPELRDLLACFLNMRWNATVVSNGKEALEEIRRERPDVVILDIMMPRMDGLEVVEEMRGDESTADIPIIMMTASTRDSDTHDSVWRMAVGTDVFITKPFEPQELMAKVEEILREQVQRRRAGK
jgi:twitching motility two-component system response regulator PilH